MAKKTYTIETPNTRFSGVREGLTFTDGKAETTDKKLAQLLISDGDGYGYFCAELNKPFPQPVVETEPDGELDGDKDPEGGEGEPDGDKDPEGGDGEPEALIDQLKADLKK